MKRLKRFWDGFKDIAIIFSFAVNFVMVVSLLLLSVPAIRAVFALKTGMVEPLLNDLDSAFMGLSKAEINTTLPVEEPVPIQFDLPLDQPLKLDFDLPIRQETEVVLTRPVELNRPATFTLGGGSGTIRGSVYLQLPAGMKLPVQLDTVVPVEKTIPVRMNVPVSETVPIQMDVPVHIKLGEAGLDPAVQDLREVFKPLRTQIESLPDGLGPGSN